MSIKIETLRKKIRRMRERKKPATWEVICKKFNIVKDNGDPNTGMAENIAYGKKGKPYEPRDREIRARIGLKDMCMECRRPFRKPGAGAKTKREISLADLWWSILSQEERDLIYREHCYVSS